MRVTVTILIALALFSCKKEEVFDSPEGESMKLVHSDITSWEGTNAPLCEGGHPECGADYYLQFVVPKNAVEVEKFYIDNKPFQPESYIIPGEHKDTLKFQMHFYEHSSCNQVHPDFLMKNQKSQTIKIEYKLKNDDLLTFSRELKVQHKELRLANVD